MNLLPLGEPPEEFGFIHEGNHGHLQPLARLGRYEPLADR
jgi:hypothetical protein